LNIQLEPSKQQRLLYNEIVFDCLASSVLTAAIPQCRVKRTHVSKSPRLRIDGRGTGAREKNVDFFAGHSILSDCSHQGGFGTRIDDIDDNYLPAVSVDQFRRLTHGLSVSFFL
jgi:hypothetical protein